MTSAAHQEPQVDFVRAIVADAINDVLDAVSARVAAPRGRPRKPVEAKPVEAKDPKPRGRPPLDNPTYKNPVALRAYKRGIYNTHGFLVNKIRILTVKHNLAYPSKEDYLHKPAEVLVEFLKVMLLEIANQQQALIAAGAPNAIVQRRPRSPHPQAAICTSICSAVC
jgi:hypothetical protein